MDEFQEIVSNIGPVFNPQVSISAYEINEVSVRLGEAQVLLQRYMGKWLKDPTTPISEEAPAILSSLKGLTNELISSLEDFWDYDDDEDEA